MNFNFLFAFVLLFCQLLNSQPILHKVKNFYKTDILKHSQWGISFKYVGSNDELFSYNPELALAPASGLKIITTATALNYLGEDFQFTTKLYYSGNISPEGILNGNVYIVGGGDPTLGSDVVKNSLSLNKLLDSLSNVIKSLGIRKIVGSVIADNLMYEGNSVPDYWQYMDLGNYYGAGAEALTIHENSYDLYFLPAKNIGDTAEIAEIVPQIPNLVFSNYMLTGPVGSGDNGYIYSAPYQFFALLRGSIPQGYNTFKIKGSIPDPALFAAQIFSKKLKDDNVDVLYEPYKLNFKREYDENKLIAVIKSPPLKDIVSLTNKKSINLYAELLLKAISFRFGGKGNTMFGTGIIKKYLDSLKISTQPLDLYDGSGLSRTNTITAKLMTDFLSAITEAPYFTSFYNSLGIAGVSDDESSYKNFGSGTILEGNARLKSGYINKVRSISGYVKGKSGKLIAFSLIANNFFGSAKQIDAIHSKIIEFIAVNN